MRRYGFGWARPKLQQKRKKTGFPSALLERADATIQIAEGNEELIEGRVMMTDLFPNGVSIFSTKPIPKDSFVNIVIQSKRYLYLRGVVEWSCIQNTSTRVFSSKRYDYRIRVRLMFESSGERDAMKRFVAKLRQNGEPRVIESQEQRVTKADIQNSVKDISENERELETMFAQLRDFLQRDAS